MILPLGQLTAQSAETVEDWVYTVRPGDNIWNLSERYLKGNEYTDRVVEYNNVEDPRNIPPGTKLLIPIAWLKDLPKPVRITNIRGSAELIKSGEQQSQPLDIGHQLAIGDQIVTGPESSVSLLFANGARLILQSDGRLQLDTLTSFGESGMVDTRLRLEQGRVESRSPKLKGRDSRFEIHTPAAVTAVRGTRFRVSAEPAPPASRVEVTEGEVGVTGSGTTRSVPEGFGTLTEKGKAPEIPRALLPPPDLGQLPELITGLPQSLNWDPLPGAERYRFQLAREDEFNSLLLDRLVEGNRFLLQGLDEGTYVVGLRGIDALGLEGFRGKRPIRIELAIAAPRQLIPDADAELTEPNPLFRWSSVENADGYRFQLATESGFALPLIDRNLDATEIHLVERSLPPGTYYWRLAGQHKNGRTGPFGEYRALRIAAPPPAGRLQPLPVWADGVAVHLRWQDAAGREDTSYQLQLAADPDFTRLIGQFHVIGQGVALPYPPLETFFYRVRPWPDEVSVLPFSETQIVIMPYRLLPPTSGW